MPFKELLIKETDNCMTLTINRPKNQNNINLDLLKDFNNALTFAEKNPKCRIILIEGNKDIFCSGMDFKEVALSQNQKLMHEWASLFMSTMKRFTTSSKVIVSRIHGKVIGGGMGFVAASDWVIAGKDANFKLTEALWGLLPAMVAPFLIRRIGFQKAYSLSLTTRGMDVKEAHAINLVDEINENFDEATNDLLMRLTRIRVGTVQELKGYFGKLSTISNETESEAIKTITRLLQLPQVQTDIRNFVEKGQLPWESKGEG